MGDGEKSKQKEFLRNRLALVVNRRALSPIFATLVILAVVTILFIPIFIWATGTTSETQDSWQTSGLIATERIVIEEVNLKADPLTCNIYVRNIGKTAVEINDVLIIGPDNIVSYYEKGDFLPSNPVTGITQKAIVQGELIEIEIIDFKGLTLSSNQVYTVKVYTVRGVGEAYQVVT